MPTTAGARSIPKTAPPSSKHICEKHKHTKRRTRRGWLICDLCQREWQRASYKRAQRKSRPVPAPSIPAPSIPAPSIPMPAPSRKKPTSPCLTCQTNAWRRLKRGGIWFCGECRNLKIAAKQRATQERTRATREAELQAKRLTLPRWQQSIYRHEEQDDLIWRLFTLERLNMEMWAKGRAQPMPVQGRDWVVRAHLLRRITAQDRLFAVFQGYGSMLEHGEDVGDATRPPWWEAGKSSFTRR